MRKLLFLFVVFVLAACSYESAVEKLIVDGGDKIYLNTSMTTYQISLKEKPQGFISYSSSNESVATVDPSGVVSIHKSGTVTVTVKRFQTREYVALEAKVELFIEQLDIAATGLTLDYESMFVSVGRTAKLTATVSPANATNQAVKWISSDERIATVTQSGVIIASSIEGTATIIAMTDGGQYSQSCEVTTTKQVFPVENITIHQNSADIVLNVPYKVGFDIAPVNASNKEVEWFSDNEEVAIPDVANEGFITGHKIGTTDVTVKTKDGGFQRTITVTVVLPPAQEGSPAYDLTEEGTYEISGDGFVGDVEDLRIADNVYGVPVTSIGSNAFQGNTTLKSVELPSTIKSIGSHAFSAESVESKKEKNTFSMVRSLFNSSNSSGNLTRVTFNEGLESIGDHAFAKQKMKAVLIPSTVTTVGENAFIDVPLETLYIDSSTVANFSTDDTKIFTTVSRVYVKDFIELSDQSFIIQNYPEHEKFSTGYVVYSTTKVTEETLAYRLDGDSYTVTGIGTYTEPDVIIPDTYKEIPVTTIAQNAFKDNNFIKSVIIGENITKIEDYAFSLSDAGTEKFVLTIKDGSKPLVIGKSAFESQKIDSLEIPSRVTEIQERAFWNHYSAMQSLTFRDGHEPLVIANGSFEDSTGKELVIPSRVINIGVGAFSRSNSRNGNELEKVVISDGGSKLNIGSNAFAGNHNLKTLVLSSREMSIASGAFDGNYLTTLEIPATLTDIAEGAFSGNKYTLQNIVVASGNPKYEAVDNVLYTKDKKTLLLYPLGNSRKSFTVPNQVEKIAASAFAPALLDPSKALEEIVLSQNLKTIAEKALASQQFSRIMIPSGVISIEKDAFLNNGKLFDVSIDSEMIANLSDNDSSLLTVATAVYVKSTISLADQSFIKKIFPFSAPNSDGYVEYSREELGQLTYRLEENSYAVIGLGKYTDSDLVIPDTYKGKPITKIADGAFEGNTPFKSIMFGKNITEVEEKAFLWTDSVNPPPATILTLNEGLQIIAENAFRRCNIENLVIPSTVKKIGNSAFMDSPKIKTLEIKDSNILLSIESNAFNNHQLESFTIPSRVKFIGERAFAADRLSGVSAIKDFTIAEGDIPLDIGKSAFTDVQIKDLVIPSRVTSIGDSAFLSNLNSGSIKTLTIADGEKSLSIGANAFQRQGIKSLIIPERVTEIGGYAFSQRAPHGAMTTLEFKESERKLSIGQYSFENQKIVDLKIPAHVSSLDAKAFYVQDNANGTLKKLVLDYGTSLYVSNEVFMNQKLETIELLGVITELRSNVFAYNSTIKTITLGESVSGFEVVEGILYKIDSSRDTRNRSLQLYPNADSRKKLILNDKINKIHSWAVYGASSLEEIWIPSSVTSIEEKAFQNLSPNVKIKVAHSEKPDTWHANWFDNLSNVEWGATQ
ncbi:MAG: leucine-rich repeat protein [Treponemataceae bacterium]